MVPRPLIALAMLFAAMGTALGAPKGTPSPSAAPTPTPAPPITSAYVSPRIWIFCGTPGDEEHHEEYEKLLAHFRDVLGKRFNIPPSDMTVLYGPKDAGYDGPCTRPALLAEIDKIVAHTQKPDAAPVWIFFIGHANPIAGGAFFNLPGPDISSHDLGAAFHDANPATPMVFFVTTACGAAFLQPLAGPNRIVATATTPKDKENETEYPEAVVEALDAPDTDTNHDGYVSVTELFLAAHARVLQIYKAEDLIVMEHSLLDGDGDGHGTQRPASVDADPASKIGLRITTAHKFD